MKTLLFFLFGVICLYTSVWGLGYSCRDGKGTKYFADSLQRLPQSCEGEIWQFKQQNFPDIPTAKEPLDTRSSNNLFEQMIKEDSLGRKFDHLNQLAVDAVEKYEKGAELLNIPKRRWHYGQKARVKNGQKLIQDARQAKQDILINLETLKLSSQQQTEIETQLAPIK